MEPSDRKRALSLSILAFTMLAGSCLPSYAISFHFSPTTMSLVARPGETINRSLNLTLAADAATTHFKTRVEDWWRSADNDRTFYAVPGTISRSCAPWCSVNPVETSAKPGETITIKLSVRIPSDVKPGGYWAALTVDEVPDPAAPKPNGVAMVFRASLSVGIYIEIPDATRTARITAVHVTNDRVGVTLINEGNIPLRVNGTFEFRRPGEDTPVATAQVGGDPILPEPINTCTFTTNLPDPLKLPTGKYTVRVIVDAGLDHLLGAEKSLDIIRVRNTP